MVTKLHLEQLETVAVDVEIKTRELETSSSTMDQLLALQTKLTADCDKIQKMERKIKNEIISLTKKRVPKYNLKIFSPIN